MGLEWRWHGGLGVGVGAQFVGLGWGGGGWRAIRVHQPQLANFLILLGECRGDEGHLLVVSDRLRNASPSRLALSTCVHRRRAAVL